MIQRTKTQWSVETNGVYRLYFKNYIHNIVYYNSINSNYKL